MGQQFAMIIVGAFIKIDSERPQGEIISMFDIITTQDKPVWLYPNSGVELV